MRLGHIWILVLVTACAPRGASEAEKNRAMDDSFRCMEDAVSQLDDSKSDPASVAYGGLAYCQPSVNRVVDVLGRDIMSLDAKRRLKSNIENTLLKAGTALVLKKRAQG